MTEPDKPDNIFTLDDSTAIGQDQLSAVLGISDRRIRQLGGQKVLSKTSKGHYHWPGVIKQYCDYLRGNGEAKEANLKQRELELKCERLEQTIAEYDQARRDDVERDCWADMQDFLAEYKSELDRLPLDESQMQKLNSALERAVTRVENFRANKKLSSAPEENRSDSVD